MFKWIKALFSDTDTLETVIKKGAEIIDESFFTDQEKADEKRKLLGLLFEFMNKTKYMSRARRVMAFLFVAEYILLINVAVIGMVVGAAWVDTLKIAIVDWAQTPVNIVVGFYFFTGILKGVGK